MDSLPPMPTREFSPLGYCVYCGASEGLHREHIVPYGLSGTWVVPEASCAGCGEVTSQVEMACLRGMFGPLRVQYDLASRRKKQRPGSLPMTFDFGEGKEELQVATEEHLLMWALPLYHLPDLITGRPYYNVDSPYRMWTKLWSYYWSSQRDLGAAARKRGARYIASETTLHVGREDYFNRMLAKIALVYATCALGRDAFVPSVTRHVLVPDFRELSQYVGGYGQEEPPDSDLLHEVSLEVERFNRPDLVIVRLRLFACLGAPVYYVVCGHLSPASALAGPFPR